MRPARIIWKGLFSGLKLHWSDLADDNVRWDVAREGLNRKHVVKAKEMAYKYIAEEWANPEKSFVDELMRQRLVEWRKQQTVTRIERPNEIRPRKKTRVQSQSKDLLFHEYASDEVAYANNVQDLDEDPNEWVFINSSQRKVLDS
jgi:hypothetical protein